MGILSKSEDPKSIAELGEKIQAQRESYANLKVQFENYRNEKARALSIEATIKSLTEQIDAKTKAIENFVIENKDDPTELKEKKVESEKALEENIQLQRTLAVDSASAYVGVVSSGDFVQGGSLGSFSKGGYIIELMNLVGYDALTLGNHQYLVTTTLLFGKISTNRHIGVQDICNYLEALASEMKILLPISPMSAFEELRRIGMPADRKGYDYRTFTKYYKRV